VTDLQRGEAACVQCGLVVAESAVDTGPEWEKNRDMWTPLKLAVKTDMAVKPEHGGRWRGLKALHRKTLDRREKKLVKIKTELKRIRECVGLPRHVAEEAEALAKRHFDATAVLPPEAVAVAVLWMAAKAAGAPRPLVEFLACSKADEGRVRKTLWRLMEAVRPGRRPGIEDYVAAVAARVNLPATVAESALDILRRNRRLLIGKNPWVWAAAALWLASSKRLLMEELAEAVGANVESIENAAKQLKAAAK
jgi:transcription initiation factor TFIIB